MLIKNVISKCTVNMDLETAFNSGTKASRSDRNKPLNAASFVGNDSTELAVLSSDKNRPTAPMARAVPELVHSTLVISSRDRDRSKYPSCSKYRVELPEVFKNVHSIELVKAIIPDRNDVKYEPFLVLNVGIPNASITVKSTNDVVSNSFCLLDIHQSDNVMNKFVHVTMTGSTGAIHSAANHRFDPVLTRLAYMDIEITDVDSTVFNFGDDSAGPNKSLQNWLTFDIATWSPKFESDRIGSGRN